MSQRTERVQKLARQVLGELIQGLKDPRIGFATVTAVRITPDLRYARVLVSVMGEPSVQEETMQGLKSATPFLRAELGHQIRLKYTPELHFELDHATDTAERLDQNLKQIHADETREGQA